MNEEYKDDRIRQGRLRYVRFSGDFCIILLTNRAIGDFIVNPLPADSRFMRMGVDALDNLMIVFESQQFEMLYEGDEIPFHGDMVFRRNPVLKQVN